MTELKLETAVRGVRVVRDTVNVLVRMASTEAGQGNPTANPSHKRHLPSKLATPESDDGKRSGAMYGGSSAFRAGRLAGFAGALVRRNPAFTGRSLSPRGTAFRTRLQRDLPFHVVQRICPLWRPRIGQAVWQARSGGATLRGA